MNTRPGSRTMAASSWNSVELDRAATDGDPHAGQVDLDVGDPEHLGAAGSGRLGPPQHGPDPGHELPGLNGLTT